jgi:integrase/recombinase XerD
MILEETMAITLNIALEKYLYKCQSENKSHKTLMAYQDTLHDFTNFVGDIPVANLAKEHIQKYLEHITKRPGRHGHLSSHSVHKHYSVVRTFTRWLYEQQYVASQITDFIELPQPALDMPDILTNDDVDHLLEYLSQKGEHRDLVIFEMLLETGLRVQELTSLNLENVDLDNRILQIKDKREGNTTIPFNVKLKRNLIKYIQHHRTGSPAEKALFINRFGNRLELEGLNMLIKRTLHHIREEGKYGAETLRNTFAVSFLRNGGNIITLHAILRNADFRSTQRYADVLANAE